MKCFLVLVLLVTLANSEPEDELRPEWCQFPKYSPFRRECALFKCSKDRTRVVTIPCPCLNKLSYNKERFDKPYPECCSPDC